jgi:organic radical activating enzyme
MVKSIKVTTALNHSTQPHPNNFCGGNFQDWLEVNLIEKCNGKCSWCIEKNGYHPKHHAPWQEIAEKIISSGKTNIILLGGEPTLYPHLPYIIQSISLSGCNVWITTNGGKLSPEFISEKLVGITGINISIHSYDLYQNKKTVGVDIEGLEESIVALHQIGANVRFNCNCISGNIDSAERIEQYVWWAKSKGADKIRFAELKQDNGNFVNLAKILNYRCGLNDDPFLHGCNCDAIIHGMPVNFRQMCGLQTEKRVKPINPVQCAKKVLYYDGIFYDGWQTEIKEEDVTDKELVMILREVEKGVLTSEEAFAKLKGSKEKEVIREVVRYEGSGGCQY